MVLKKKKERGRVSALRHSRTSCLPAHVSNWLPVCLACNYKTSGAPARLQTWSKPENDNDSLCPCVVCVHVFVPPCCPSVYLSVRVSACACVLCRVYLCVAVQKMAEAHMQNLGVYPPLEDPCEDEEEEGGEASPAKAAGETETR